MKYKDYKMRTDRNERAILADLCCIETRLFLSYEPPTPTEWIGFQVDDEQIEAFFGKELHDKIYKDYLSGNEKAIEWAKGKISKFIESMPKEDVEKAKQIANKFYKKR